MPAMVALSQVVDVSVKLSRPALTAAGFGRPAILGTSGRLSGRWQLYTALSAMLSDGFSQTDLEYQEAASMLAQESQNGKQIKSWLVIQQGETEQPSDALAAAVENGAVWYATCATSRARADIEDIAAWTETSGMRMFVGQSSDAELLAASYDPENASACVASALKARGYNRSAVMFHHDDSECAAAALLGSVLPFAPGTITWAHRVLVGVTVSPLSGGDFIRLTGTSDDPGSGKNAFVYVTVGGSSRTERGMMASGLWADARRAGDWFDEELTIELANLIFDSKVPFDRSGLMCIQAAIFAVITRAQSKGVLDSGSEASITMPELSEMSASDKANRVLRPAPKISANLSGAIHFVPVEATVTV